MIYSFAEFEVDDAEFLFLANGEQVQIEPKVLRLLIYLLQNPNRLIRKQELLDALWPSATVTENALTRVIGLLRKTLGDDSQNPRFVQTVPTAGYRFVAEVRASPDAGPILELPPARSPADAVPAAAPTSTAAPVPYAGPRQWLLLAAIVLLAIAVTAAFALHSRARRHALQQPVAASTVSPRSYRSIGKAPSTAQVRNPAAYDAYVRARFLFLNEISHGDDFQYAEATREVETASRLDPQFADPYALLAQIIERSVHHGRGNVSGEFARSYLLANKALALDPGCALAHTVLGELHADKEGDLRWEAAVNELKTAIALNPSDAFARGLLGDIYVRTGLLDRALEQAEIAHRLDPSFNNYSGVKIRVLEYQQRFQEASDLCASTSEAYCALLLWESGQHEEAWTAVQAGLRNPVGKGSLVYLIPTYHAFLLAQKGYRREADRAIESVLKSVSRSDTFFAFSEYHLGAAYAVMREDTRAINLLESASLDGFPCYPMYANDPNLAPIRSNPRFIALLERLQRQDQLFRKTLQ